MIEPVSTSEKLMFATARIETIDADSNISTGTGFFFRFANNNSTLPVLLTNKHVVRNGKVGKIRVHVANTSNGQYLPSGSFIDVTIDGIPPIGFEGEAIHHPGNVDLCAIPLGPIINMLGKRGQTVYYVALDESLIPSQQELENLNAIEEITMIGYPHGLWDERNNLPLLRRGITASHPAIDYNGTSTTVIDAACFPGSSGSPVLLLNEGSWVDKLNNNYIGTTRVKLLGLLASGPQITAQGRIIVVDIPTVQTPIAATQVMMHLGYIVKAKEITLLGDVLKRRFPSLPTP